MWQTFQTASPTQSGYLTVTTTGGAGLAIDRSESSSPRDESRIVIRVTSSAVAVGDEGNRPFVRGRIPKKSCTAVEWDAPTDPNCDGTFTPVAVWPRMDIVADSVLTLTMATRRMGLERGSLFTPMVRVLDE